jgi:hypothetical protein
MTAHDGNPEDPIVTFYKIVEGARDPARASGDWMGSMPLRAYKYCDPLVVASSFGWYLFPPVDFGLHWDGVSFKWNVGGGNQWYPLHMAQIPGSARTFQENSGKSSEDHLPPFLVALPESGIVQIWSGYAAATRRGWSLLVRGPVNLSASRDYQCLEGMVESDWWNGPIFSNIRFTKTDSLVFFRKDEPLFQVQPIPQQAYGDPILSTATTIKSPAEWPEKAWESYRTAIMPDDKRSGLPGSYAKCARKRRRDRQSG